MSELVHLARAKGEKSQVAACGKFLYEGVVPGKSTTEVDSATCVPCIDAVSQKVLAKLQEQRSNLEALQTRRMKVRLETSEEPAGAPEPKFFSYDPGGEGFETHDSLEKARQHAQAALDLEEDYASDSGWPEMVEDIAYGEIHGRVVETERKPWPEHPDFDEYVAYRLEDFE